MWSRRTSTAVSCHDQLQHRGKAANVRTVPRLNSNPTTLTMTMRAPLSPERPVAPLPSLHHSKPTYISHGKHCIHGCTHPLLSVLPTHSREASSPSKYFVESAVDAQAPQVLKVHSRLVEIHHIRIGRRLLYGRAAVGVEDAREELTDFGRRKHFRASVARRAVVSQPLVVYWNRSQSICEQQSANTLSKSSHGAHKMSPKQCRRHTVGHTNAPRTQRARLEAASSRLPTPSRRWPSRCPMTQSLQPQCPVATTTD